MESVSELSLSQSPEKERDNVSTSSTSTISSTDMMETNGQESNSDETVFKGTLRVVNQDHNYCHSYKNPWREEMEAKKQAQLIMEQTMRKFRNATRKLTVDVLNGNWNEVKVDLREVEPFIGSSELYLEFQLRVLQQQYLELLEEGKPDEALTALQKETALIKHFGGRIEKLTMYLLCKTSTEVRERAKWAGKSARTQLAENLEHIYAPQGPYSETCNTLWNRFNNQ